MWFTVLGLLVSSGACLMAKAVLFFLAIHEIFLCLLQPLSLMPFDIKSNVNVARNAYDPQGNPWFGKSLNSVDFPNWGHPHQVGASWLSSRFLVKANLTGASLCNQHAALHSPV